MWVSENDLGVMRFTYLVFVCDFAADDLAGAVSRTSTCFLTVVVVCTRCSAGRRLSLDSIYWRRQLHDLWHSSLARRIDWRIDWRRRHLYGLWHSSFVKLRDSRYLVRSCRLSFVCRH